MSWDLVDTEERRLGLDPSKYTKKTWNSADYINQNPVRNVEAGNATVPKFIPNEVRQMYEMRRAEELKRQQEEVMGRSAISDEEYQLLKQRLLRGY